MFTLPLVATKRLSVQEGVGLKMERSPQTSAVMQTKWQRKVEAERNGDGTKKHRETGKRDTPRCGTGKKKSPGALLADLRGLCGT